jgi:ketosteroid isomerase-like protein
MKTLTKLAALAAALVATTAVAVPTGAVAGDVAQSTDSRCVNQLAAANAAFDAAFFARDLDAFINFYSDDATIIYFNGTRIYSKEEARANNAVLFTRDWTASFGVLKTSIQDCRSGQIIEDGHFTINGTTSHSWSH